MSLFMDLLLVYLIASAIVTLALLRFFRVTDEKATAAGILELRPRAMQDTAPGDGGASRERRAA